MTLLQARTTKVVLSKALFLSGVLSLVPCGFAADITLGNPSFQIPPVVGIHDPCEGTGCFFSAARIPDWANNPATSGQLIPSVSGAGRILDSFAPDDGNTSAFTNGSTISQLVRPTVQEDVRYTLTVEIGHRNDGVLAGTADLLVSGRHSMETVDATGTDPGPGHWGTFTASFVGNSTNVGDDITIQLNRNAGACVAGVAGCQGNFDSVRLTATPVTAAAPEPATLGLMVLGLLAGIGFAGRKRRN